MDIRSVANAPRCVLLGGLPYFVGRLTPFGHGVLLAYLEDVLGFGDLGTEAAADALLRDAEARPLVLYAALYRHNPSFSIDDATALAPRVDDPRYVQIINLLFARSAWLPTPHREGMPAPTSRSNRGWAYALDRLSERRGLDYDTLVHWSYDQLLNAMYTGEPPASAEEAGGVGEVGDAEEAGAILSHEEVVRLWEARRAERLAKEEVTAPEMPPPADNPAVLEAIRRLEASKSEGETDPESQFAKKGDNIKKQIALAEAELADIEARLDRRGRWDGDAEAEGEPEPGGDP